VRAVIAQRGEIAERVGGPGVAVVRPPQVHPFVGAHVGIQIVVALVEPGTRAHVQQILNGGALEGRAAEFRDDLVDGCGDRQRPAAGQHASDCRGH